MAFGIPASEVIEEMEALGINLHNGCAERDEAYYLSTKGIGREKFMNRGHGLPVGHYLVEVPSLNICKMTHCVLMLVQKGEMTVFDPNKHREGVKFHDIFSAENGSLEVLSFTQLDDFSDLK
jgi:hypothetical protein